MHLVGHVASHRKELQGSGTGSWPEHVQSWLPHGDWAEPWSKAPEEGDAKTSDGMQELPDGQG